MELNKVLLVGRLTANPELKTLPTGVACCNFRVAANHTWKDQKTNTRREDTCFIDVDAFDRQAKFVNDWFSKGNQILIEGRIKFHTWEAKDGTTRSRHSIVALNMGFVDGAAVHGARKAAVTDQAGDAAGPAPPSDAGSPVANRRREMALATVGAPDDEEEKIPF